MAYAIGACGAALSLLHDSRLVHASIAVAVGVATAGFATSVQAARTHKPRSSTTIAGMTGAVICFALTGFVILLGPAALLAIPLFTLTSPAALHHLSAIYLRMLLRRRRSSHPATERPGTTDNATPPAIDLTRPARSLTDAELCLAWRSSAHSLNRLQLARKDLPQQLQLLEERQQYLDELERRHPETFTRWLAEGTRSAITSSPPRPGQRQER